jgi:hypothetical protein
MTEPKPRSVDELPPLDSKEFDELVRRAGKHEFPAKFKGKSSHDILWMALEGDEDARELLKSWKRGGGRTRSVRLEQRYAKAMLKLEQTEAELARAFNRWAKLRNQVRRYGKELDKLTLEVA